MGNATETVTQRGQSEPPKELAQFIQLVNAERPFERAMPDLLAAFETALQGDATNSLRDRWVKLCEGILATLSLEARAFLGPAEDFSVFSARYEQLESAREVLPAIARRHAQSGNLVIPNPEMPGLEHSLSLSVKLVVSDKGLLTTSESPLLAVLRGVRADRIRACAICGRIFWAARVNSECCSERCRKTYNQRKSRKDRGYKKFLLSRRSSEK